MCSTAHAGLYIIRTGARTATQAAYATTPIPELAASAFVVKGGSA
jgi:hypothetical protein